MSVVSYPVDAPFCPLLGSFREQPATSIIGFETEVGPAKQRRRSTAISVATDMTVSMSTAEKSAFETWFNSTLKSGSLTFDAPYPVGGSTKRWRFRAMPTYDRTGPKWTVGMQLLRLS